MDNAPQDTPREANGSNGRRKRLLLIVVGVFLLAGIAVGAHWFLFGRFSVSTDNAYVGGNVVQITPQVGGTVVSIGADDTQFVKAGQPLVQLDRANAEVALQQAESQLAKAVRDVRQLFAGSSQQRANVEQRQSDL